MKDYVSTVKTLTGKYELALHGNTPAKAEISESETKNARQK